MAFDPQHVLERAVGFVNPGQLQAQHWFGLLLVKCLGLALLDFLIDWVVRTFVKPKKLPFRVNYPKVKGLAALEAIDFTYLSINQVVEYVFISNVFFYMFTSPTISRQWSEMTVLNTLPALFLLFAIDDFFYALYHRAMHLPFLYQYIHKHHHRQILPKRGYIDAGNEHPLEQVGAQFLLWYTIKIVERITGIHVTAMFVHFILYAVFALLNHTSYDVQFNFLGFEYTVRAHEMHHRLPDCNMAQYFMGWDRLMGTYREYSDGKRPTSAVLSSGKMSKLGSVLAVSSDGSILEEDDASAASIKTD